MTKKFLNILSIALIYCGAVFGAGFASGREIFSFFSCYKVGGVVSSVFVGFLFSFFGYCVCNYSKKMNIKNSEEYFRKIFSHTLATIFTFTTNAFLILSFCIMITGCGVLFLEQFSVPTIWGSLISLLICYFVIRNDVSGLEKFNFAATPVMFLGVVVLCVICLKLEPVSAVYVDEVLSPAVSGVLYLSYNIVSATAVMVSATKIAKTPHQAGIGGIVGGIFIAVPLVMMSGVLAHHWEVASNPLPFFALINNHFPRFSLVCTVVLYLAMMTTAVSSGVAVVENIAPAKNGKYTFLLCLLAFLISFLPFASLVQTVYSAFGIIGFALVAGIIIKLFRK